MTFLPKLNTIMNSPEIIHSPHLSDADQQDLELELTQVRILLQTNCKLNM